MTAPTESMFAFSTDDDSVDIQDFTIKKKRIRFKIDNDVFEATAIMGLPMMQNMVNLSKDLTGMVESKNFGGITNIFNELLLPDSAKRFNERLLASGDDAIDVQKQLMPILHYLLEKFGLRPTQPPSLSLPGSPNENVGTTSTAGSSTEASGSTN